jgi:hypothetical protein
VLHLARATDVGEQPFAHLAERRTRVGRRDKRADCAIVVIVAIHAS